MAAGASGAMVVLAQVARCRKRRRTVPLIAKRDHRLARNVAFVSSPTGSDVELAAADTRPQRWVTQSRQPGRPNG